MAYVNVCAFVLITFLHQSWTQGAYRVPIPWYSANVVNDGDYSPRPITEIFSTNPPLTFSNVNPIIVSTPKPDGIATFNGMLPSSSASPITFPSTTSDLTSSFQTFPPSTVLGSTFSTSSPFSTPPSSSSMLTNLPSTFSTVSPSTVTTARPSTFSTTSPTTFSTFPPSTFSTQAPIRTVSSTPIPAPIVLPNELPNGTPGNNYFVFLQKGQETAGTTIPTYNPPVNGVAVTNPSDPMFLNGPLTSPIPFTRITSRPKGAFVTTPQPGTFRIRVPGPVVNIKIQKASTPKPPRQRQRQRQNNYDNCLRGCKGQKKEPICASVLGKLDAKTLKGFPSVCHMACHNSFRKPAYEMLLDGRCGRLRPRIHAVGNLDKITGVELKKSLYEVVEDDPESLVDFVPAN